MAASRRRSTPAEGTTAEDATAEGATERSAAGSGRSPRALWKGAISFGLVHVPVALHAASESGRVDFDWLDRRTMDPVGYQRINKKTGKPLEADDIVKGVEVGKGRYVVLTSEEIRKAFPKSTQTIEIESFVQADEVPFVFFERPYHLAPIGRAQKVYALLREALLATARVGVARVVIHSRQHLAIVVPSGRALVLNLLRWGAELRSPDKLALPPAGVKAAGLKDSELAMARRVIEDMSSRWEPARYRDQFTERIMQWIDARSRAGKVESVEALEEMPVRDTAQVIDLTELLKRSLGADRSASAGRRADQRGSKKRRTASPRRAAPGRVATSRAKTGTARRAA